MNHYNHWDRDVTEWDDRLESAWRQNNLDEDARI